MSDQAILSPPHQQQQRQQQAPSTRPSPNSVVLESILTQIDRQDDNIKQLQRAAKSHRETTARHEELIQQQQLLIANLLQQQSSLFTMVSSVNDKQQQSTLLTIASNQSDKHQLLGQAGADLVALSEGSGGSLGIQSASSDVFTTTGPRSTAPSQEHFDQQQQVLNQVTNKLALKEAQIAELLTQQASDQSAIAITSQGYKIQAEEIAKLNQTVQRLQMELSVCQGELSKAHASNEIDSSKQVLRLKPVYETLDQQLKRLENNIQQISKTTIQLIIKTLVGRATIIECDLADTLAVVKYKISEQTQIPLKDQILLHDGKELNNEHTVHQLGLLNQTTLHLILKNRGRGH